MDQARLNESAQHLIYLIACALHDAVPDETVVSRMNFDAVFRLARHHELTAISWFGLENASCISVIPEELARQWREEKEKAVRKNLLLDVERRKILSELEKAGIWYLPLKGAILKDLYPRFGMRQMGDNDILYDAEGREKVVEIFRKQGYSYKGKWDVKHDVFEKPPLLEFEMHRLLFPQERWPVWAEKYSRIQEIMLPDPGKQFGFHFSDEEFYVYVTAHAQKHFLGSGTGLRTLVDFYVLNWKKGASLNWDYLKAELASLGLADYEEQSRLLALKLFAEPNPSVVDSLSQEEREFLAFHLGSGTYGNLTNRLARQMEQLQQDDSPAALMSKIKYCLQRTFPGRQWCKIKYPFFYQYPFLIPALWAYRFFRIIFKKRKQLRQEWEMLKSK